MGTGIIGLAPKRLREYFGEQIFSYPPATRHREALAKWVPSMHESTVLGGLVPHTESTALGALEPLAESTALGGLVPRTEHAALGGLPLTSATFHHFRAHDPCTGIDGLSASPGRFVARVSASVATTEGCTGRGSISPAADTVFASVFAIPIEGGTGSAEALAAATIIAQSTSLSRSSTQKTDFTATTGSTVSASASLGTPAPPSATPPSDAKSSLVSSRLRR